MYRKERKENGHLINPFIYKGKSSPAFSLGIIMFLEDGLQRRELVQPPLSTLRGT